MVQLTIVDRQGAEQIIDGSQARSLMEAIREAGVDDLLALCGGCCSCATCHVFVESEAQIFEPLSEDEDDLLSSSDFRQANSRLSCQLILTSRADGLRIVIAPED